MFKNELELAKDYKLTSEIRLFAVKKPRINLHSSFILHINGLIK